MSEELAYYLKKDEYIVRAVCHPLYTEDARPFLEDLGKVNELASKIPLETSWEHPPKSVSLYTSEGTALLFEKTN